MIYFVQHMAIIPINLFQPIQNLFYFWSLYKMMILVKNRFPFIFVLFFKGVYICFVMGRVIIYLSYMHLNGSTKGPTLTFYFFFKKWQFKIIIANNTVIFDH